MKLFNCVVNIKDNAIINLRDLVMPDAKNLFIQFEALYLHDMAMRLLINYVAHQLKDYFIEIHRTYGSKFDIEITCNDEAKSELDSDDANIVQNALFYAILPEWIEFKDTKYTGYSFMWDESVDGETHYDLVQWPESQDLVDNGETVIPVPESEFAWKMLLMPAFFLMK